MNSNINSNLKINPSVSELYFDAIINEKLNISSTGAILAYSGEKTGRSPKDKRIVSDDNTKDIWWGSVNIPLRKDLFNHYRDCAVDYLSNDLSKMNRVLYQIDAYANWNDKDKVKIRLYCSSAYSALFLLDMLIPTGSPKGLVAPFGHAVNAYNNKPFDSEPDFTIYNVGELNLENFKPSPISSDPSLTSTLVAIDFTQGQMVIYGTKYAGEMKKGILTLMMYLMPIKKQLPLHSSANVDNDINNLCVFFGLSGTGKTTLSSDSTRKLIGDDEHVWTSDGLFNIEGGCYAKCINLQRDMEPEIFNAIKYGAVLENVVVDPTYNVKFDDESITENTRCAYPLHYIPNALIPANVNIHPTNIILLTCDVFGILPPIAKLDYEQAVYYFISGYTSKVSGTEIGIDTPQAVFSACFGDHL